VTDRKGAGHPHPLVRVTHRVSASQWRRDVTLFEPMQTDEQIEHQRLEFKVWLFVMTMLTVSGWLAVGVLTYFVVLWRQSCGSP
jgi:hypothetical protein